jgi:xylulose-5-phosphate/fructose-6-phosphate phosphoketolase
MSGYGWQPIFVEGSEPTAMHLAMAEAMERAVGQIRAFQQQARSSGQAFRPNWPMNVLRSPKGWSGPSEIHGDKLEGFWRSHHVPLSKPRQDPEELAALEAWMRSYRPEGLFTKKVACGPTCANSRPRATSAWAPTLTPTVACSAKTSPGRRLMSWP